MPETARLYSGRAAQLEDVVAGVRYGTEFALRFPTALRKAQQTSVIFSGSPDSGLFFCVLTRSQNPNTKVAVCSASLLRSYNSCAKHR